MAPPLTSSNHVRCSSLQSAFTPRMDPTIRGQASSTALSSRVPCDERPCMPQGQRLIIRIIGRFYSGQLPGEVHNRVLLLSAHARSRWLVPQVIPYRRP